MWLGEKLRELIGGGISKRVEQKTELSGGKNVQLWDLREADKAKERGVEPGLYLTTTPISEPELRDSFILQKLSLSFFEKLREGGFMEQSETIIPVDTKGTMVVDPAQSWQFSPAGYIPDMHMLVVRADHVDRDKAQGIIVKALR